ncbi:hypothetical protein C0J52_23047, partial [Blattella germanica]
TTVYGSYQTVVSGIVIQTKEVVCSSYVFYLFLCKGRKSRRGETLFCADRCNSFFHQSGIVTFFRENRIGKYAQLELAEYKGNLFKYTLMSVYVSLFILNVTNFEKSEKEEDAQRFRRWKRSESPNGRRRGRGNPRVDQTRSCG